MGAAGEEVGGLGGLEGEAFFFQLRYVPGQGGGVAGDIHQTPWVQTGDGLNGVGV